ncbi:hypothetical protein Lal_00015882 [Lupinus albus]|nr:hypothetical protein Lal_00015882 [Lupinus albus]
MFECTICRAYKKKDEVIVLPFNDSLTLFSLSNRFSSSTTVSATAMAYLSAAIPKRIKLFDEIHLQQRTKNPLPREISKNLANNALIARVNGVLWDMARLLEEDSELRIYKFDDDEGRDTFWHSSAHILGQALEEEYGCKIASYALDPVPQEERYLGFYYDAFYGDLGLNDEHFKQIEKKPLEAVGVFFRSLVYMSAMPAVILTASSAPIAIGIRIRSLELCLIEIINDLPADKTITVYRCVPWLICAVDHIYLIHPLSKQWHASSAYWKVDKNRESLQRMAYLIPTRRMDVAKKSMYLDDSTIPASSISYCLDGEYLLQLEEAKKYDHRILGVKQELIYHHEWRKLVFSNPWCTDLQQTDGFHTKSV